MINKSQIGAMQTARRWLEKNRGFSDAAYRTLLRSVAGVASSKDLDNAGFEQCMAVMEAQGFQEHKRGPSYWRDQAERGGGRATWKIHALAAGSRYSLDALCLRFSDGRTEHPEELTPHEGQLLTEMLKQSNEREISRSPKPRTSGTEAAGLLF